MLGTLNVSLNILFVQKCVVAQANLSRAYKLCIFIAELHQFNSLLSALTLTSKYFPSSIISSSLSDGPRPDMPSQSRSSGQLGCKGTGAKSLDRDLGDVHTWPHSHYLMRPCNGVGGWEKCG